MEFLSLRTSCSWVQFTCIAGPAWAVAVMGQHKRRNRWGEPSLPLLCSLLLWLATTSVSAAEGSTKAEGGHHLSPFLISLFESGCIAKTDDQPEKRTTGWGKGWEAFQKELADQVAEKDKDSEVRPPHPSSPCLPLLHKTPLVHGTCVRLLCSSRSAAPQLWFASIAIIRRFPHRLFSNSRRGPHSSVDDTANTVML